MMRALYTLLLVLTATLAWAMPAPAISVPCDTSVYFINIGPGRQIYELDGHSALAVVLPDGRGYAYNYGVFDFNSPNFVWRYLKGETDYMSVAMPLHYFIQSYWGSGRRIEATRLALDSRQTQALIAVLEHDIQPQHRTYRYNYILDNCATRPLAAVERALGDTVSLAPAPIEAQPLMPVSFRNVMRQAHRNYPWYQFGIDLALGGGIDRPVSRRELSFSPVQLMEMLPDATVGGRALAHDSRTIQPQTDSIATDGPTPWYLTPMAVALAVFVMAMYLTIRDLRRRRCTRWFDSALFGVFGLAGLMLTFLIFVSVHEATSPNWLYVWLNPLCLLPAACIWIKKAQKAVIWYFFANFVAVTGLAAAWYWIPQSANAAFLPLVGADLLRTACYLHISIKSEN